MKQTALRAFVSTVVVGSVVVLALALWKLKLILALLFLGFIVAAAMRPGIEALRSRGVPRPIGILVHYVGLLALIGTLLWAVVARARGLCRRVRAPAGRLGAAALCGP